MAAVTFVEPTPAAVMRTEFFAAPFATVTISVSPEVNCASSSEPVTVTETTCDPPVSRDSDVSEKVIVTSPAGGSSSVGLQAASPRESAKTAANAKTTMR